MAFDDKGKKQIDWLQDVLVIVVSVLFILWMGYLVYMVQFPDVGREVVW